MSSLVILATADVFLADAWEVQLMPGRVAMRITNQSTSGGTASVFAAVVILDAASESGLPAIYARCPTIFVGEPRSLPFEQARMSGRARIYLGYEESRTRLREFLPLLEEVAEKQSMVDLLTEKGRRVENVRPALRSSTSDAAEAWDFLEGAVENLDSRERLIGEFRRASRHLLRASHAVFFFREADGFRADRGTSFFSIGDPIVPFLESHPAVIDGSNWESNTDPVAELSVRNRLALWGARMLVPIHDNGRLLGLIALGIRNDGQVYDDLDKTKAVFFARLLRHLLVRSSQLHRLHSIAEQSNLGAKYLPSTLILGPDEDVSRQIPLIVRDLVGQARRARQICRVYPSDGQPFRGSSGIIVETGGVWAFWEEASSEVHDAITRERVGRRALLRELALTLSHELSNALMSLSTFRQSTVERPPPEAMIDNVKRDISSLEALNRNLSLMQTMHELDSEFTDLRELAQSIGYALGLRVEIGPDPVVLSVSRKLLDFAIRSIITTITENRGDLGNRELSFQVRSTGAGSELTALLSLKGKHLELEGILPEPEADSVPNQGRLGVFLAKEILRLHNGEIHAGPGLEGTEILISVRRL